MQHIIKKKDEDISSERETIQTLQRKVQALERQVAMKDVVIAEMGIRIESLENLSYDGTMVWKISDFSARRQEARTGRTPSIYSPFFFTSACGQCSHNFTEM